MATVERLAQSSMQELLPAHCADPERHARCETIVKRWNAAPTHDWSPAARRPGDVRRRHVSQLEVPSAGRGRIDKRHPALVSYEDSLEIGP
jgi:hypothetical protein